MNRAAVWAIVRKDLASVTRNRGVLIPLIVTPIIVLGVLPMVLVLGGGALAASAPEVLTDGSAPFERIADPEFQQEVTGSIPPEARWAVFVLEVFVSPLYLLVPLIVATVIAADSFAGERERGTLEALLHTPTTDRELLTAKFLAAWLPAMIVSMIGFAGYSVLANVLAWPTLGRVFFPTATWLLLAFWVAPAIAALGLGIMVIASSKVQSLQAAHQIGSLVVLPIVVLLIAQITGVLLFDAVLVSLMGLMLWVLATLLLIAGARGLKRQRLAVRL